MNTRSSGFSIIEIVVACAIIVSLVTAAASAWQIYLRISDSSADRTQAALLTEEAGEALNLFRDTSWSGNISPLPLNTTYYLYWNGTRYATSTTPVTVQSYYTVGLSLAAVSRDGSSNIVSSGGSNDTGTRQATVTITRLGTPNQTLLTSNLYIHNVFQN